MRGSLCYRRAARASIPRSRLLIAVLIVFAVVAAVVNAEAASLTLTWNAPTTNADGSPLRDLAGYRVYLGTTTPDCPSGSFHSVSSPTSSPTSGQTVSTRITALSAGNTYFARVSAVDAAGNESVCSSSASGVAAPDITVTPTGTTSFGSVAVNGTVDRAFTVQNIGPTSLSVTATVGSPFSIVSGGSGSLAVGASRTVTVRFRPTTTGSFVGNVNFTAGGDTASRAVSGSGTTASTFALSVTKMGSGSGTVTSSPAGISCGNACSQTAASGTQFTLSAAAASGSTFAGWSGACSGSGSCTVTVTKATTVTATFNALAPSAAPLSVTKNGTGSGTVSSAPAGISCGGDCGETLAFGTPVTLTATAASGSVFAGWGGACSGTAATCSWTMSAATVVTATFNTASSGSSSPSTPPSVPGTPTVTMLTADTNAATFQVAWAAAGGAVSYRYAAGFGDGTAAQQGSVTGLLFQLRMPYHSSGASSRGFVCIRSVGATGLLSTDQSCNAVPVPAPAPIPSSPPATPGTPSVTRRATDANGVTFDIAWGAGAGATSYRYVAAFNDGSGAQEGTVTSLSLQLRMPYHRTGAAFGGFVCIRSVNAAGLSADHACNALSVPAR